MLAHQKKRRKRRATGVKYINNPPIWIFSTNSFFIYFRETNGCGCGGCYIDAHFGLMPEYSFNRSASFKFFFCSCFNGKINQQYYIIFVWRNPEILKTLSIYNMARLYETNWGIYVDINIIPCSLSIFSIMEILLCAIKLIYFSCLRWWKTVLLIHNYLYICQGTFILAHFLFT